jgi:ATP-dependent Clp protease adaptor protein ClpS
MGKKIINPRHNTRQSDAEITDRLKHLILHNDEVNTFDYVIACLIEFCRHEPIQAEQCAYITHFKGKCEIRSGSHEQLDPIRSALADKGLQVTID